jgi:predicted nucleotidyltransferase
MNDRNLDQLIEVATALRPLLGELVFVGGCVTGLLITDEAAGDPRVTLDVDAIADITSYAEYAALGDRLRTLGFREDVSENSPLCRWVYRQTILDVMPLDERILGFSNRWYAAALESPIAKRLLTDLEIRIVTAPLFVATKLEAFKGRGNGDYLESHDLEDLVAVVDGRESLVAEVRAEREELRAYIQNEIGGLLANGRFVDALPGYLFPDAASQARIALVLEHWKLFSTLRAALD